jgi:hypothetical protein
VPSGGDLEIANDLRRKAAVGGEAPCPTLHTLHVLVERDLDARV